MLDFSLSTVKIRNQSIVYDTKSKNECVVALLRHYVPGAAIAASNADAIFVLEL